VAAYLMLNFRQHLLSFRELNHNQVQQIQIEVLLSNQVLDIDCQKQIGFWNENSEVYISNKMHNLDVIKLPWNFKLLK